MADSKITALTALTAADPVNDMFPIVDVSDTTMAASGTTKRISANNILSSSPTASGALTVTGLVTAGSATVTGALTVDTTTLVANAAGYTDKVGIGTATPVDKLQITSDLATTGTGIVTANGITFQNTNATVNNYTAIQNRDSTGSQNAQIQFINVTQGTTFQGAIAFTTRTSAGDFAERARFNPTGNLAFTSGKGIDFTAVTGGTGTATGNLLNDYEEGTFTPTVIGTTIAGVGVYTVQAAKYTKVGRLVTVEVDLGWSAHTGTGNMQITGLPFTTNATVFTSVTLGYVDNIALTAGNIMTAYTSKSSTLINLNQTPTGGGATTGVPIDVAGRIMVSVTYSV